jgi:hypothetical protein
VNPDRSCRGDKAAEDSFNTIDPKAAYTRSLSIEAATKSPGNAEALIVTADRTMKADQHFATKAANHFLNISSNR